MRTWEVDDNRMIPSDLVREQDFILHIRRLRRLDAAQMVVNLVLDATELGDGGRATKDEVREKVEEWAKISNAYVAEMSNGDLFIDGPFDKGADTWPELLYRLIWPKRFAGRTKGALRRLLSHADRLHDVARALERLYRDCAPRC